MAKGKVVYCNFSEVEKRKEEMACFGYEVAKSENNKKRTKVKLTFERRQVKNLSKVKRMESEFYAVKSMTYKSAIIWVAIAAILISAYFIATSFQFRVVFLFVGIPCVGFASIIVIFKLLLFLNKNRYIKHILKEAKSACGEPPASPVVEN
ncbi:MAG: hypothetical protein J6X03_00570, partial [Bacilli bacterium]|nr:hypothetical protein [Bacilli bacterium]